MSQAADFTPVSGSIRKVSATVAWPTVVFFVLVWSCVGGVVWAAFTGVMPLWAACVVNTVLFYIAAHLNHEAIHRNISGADAGWKPLNEVLGHLGSFWFFLPFTAFRGVHLAHHRFTNDPKLDGDMWVAHKNPIAVFFSCATIIIGYEFRIWRLAKAGLISRGAMIAIYTQRTAYLLLLAIAFGYGYGVEAIMLSLAPAMLVMPFLAFFFAYAVHHPHSSRETNTASNVLLAPGWLQPLVTAVFVFQNYHLVHHLNPRIPFYQYGNVFRQMRSALEKDGAAIKNLL